MKNLQFLIGETEGGNLFKTQVDGKLFLISGQPTSAYFRSLTLYVTCNECNNSGQRDYKIFFTEYRK